jgi:protoheme IX farnesyltransferase
MTDATTNPTTGTPEAQFGDYVQLLKPRVMSLVVFTALVGLLVAPGGVSPMIGFSAILFIALGAGASGALNMWYDADIDIIMKRTRGRPVPSGRVEAGEALSIGIALSVMSVAMLGLATNWLAAGLLAFTIFFYAVIYTMWLKRLTPQNIVIGGAAGAFPPLIGWVAVTGAVSVEAVLMFGLIFMWTPPHFWALALFMKSDYHEAKVPMLTVTHGRAETRRQIWIYSLLLAPVALGLGLTSVAGPVYLAAAVGLNAIFLKHAFTVWRRDEGTAEADGFAAEKRLFRFSLSYLFLHFGALLADAALRLSGVLGV